MPLNNLSEFQAAVERHVQDDANVLDAADYQQHLEDAARRLSRIEPREVVLDIAGDGGFDYALPAPFDPDFSRVLQVEYPAGRREPEYVDHLDWTLYTDPAGTALRFRYASPAAAEVIRVTVTASHEITAVSTTVPVARQDAVVLIGAALSCEAIASHYSNTGDATILADSVDHKSKAGDYAKRAKRYMELATELLPVAVQGEVQAGSGTTSLAESRNFLTHPER